MNRPGHRRAEWHDPVGAGTDGSLKSPGFEDGGRELGGGSGERPQLLSLRSQHDDVLSSIGGVGRVRRNQVGPALGVRPERSARAVVRRLVAPFRRLSRLGPEDLHTGIRRIAHHHPPVGQKRDRLRACEFSRSMTSAGQRRHVRPLGVEHAKLLRLSIQHMNVTVVVHGQRCDAPESVLLRPIHTPSDGEIGHELGDAVPRAARECSDLDRVPYGVGDDVRAGIRAAIRIASGCAERQDSHDPSRERGHTGNRNSTTASRPRS